VYTAEFKEAAVQRVMDRQSVSAVARELGMSMQTLRDWCCAQSNTEPLGGADFECA
jgi:transposase